MTLLRLYEKLNHSPNTIPNYMRGCGMGAIFKIDMIKANELRLGNIVTVDKTGQTLKVNMIEYGYIENHYIEKDLSGITLNEEWLLKLGFIDNQIQTEAFIFTIYLYDCWHIVFKQKERFGNSESYITGFFEIHELQNIFAMLTGKELQLTT